MTRDQGVVALDFDGTIVDSMQGLRTLAWDVIMMHVSSRRAPIGPTYARYDRTTGEPFIVQLETILPDETACKRQEIAEDFERMKVEVTMAAEPFDDVVKSLPGLVGAGYRLAVVSSTRSRLVVEKLIAMRVWSYFDACLGEEAGTKTQKLHDLKARYFIGDTDRDRDHASAAGVAFFGVQRDARHLSMGARYADTFTPVTARLLEIANER